MTSEWKRWICLAWLLLIPLSANAGTANVSAGAYHTVALKNDGTLLAVGSDSSGQLGLGRPLQSSTPLPVFGLGQVRALAGGEAHTVALKQDGTVWTWGENFYGQLGDGTHTNRSTPVQVPGITGVASVSAGYGHTVALTQEGTVWAWGWNSAGQLGDGTATSRPTPAPAPGLTEVAAIVAQGSNTFALKRDGTVWAWGNNFFGQIGDDLLFTNRSTPALVQGLTGVAAIVAGGSHTVALKQDGTVWAWGSNLFGELGDATLFFRSTPAPVPGLTGVAAIAAGAFHTVALKQDGTVWAWGLNVSGTPVQVMGLTGIASIAAGGAHTVALKQDGTVWAWGENFYGQLGDGTVTSFRSTPALVSGLTGIAAIAAGGYHTLAMKQDGTVRGWGYNGAGQLGDGTITHRSTPVQVPGVTGVAAIAAGKSHTLALKQDGRVWAWGSNYSGQLGDGTYPDRSTPALVPGLTGIAAIAAGGGHTVALKQDGTVWAWGNNFSGQLGDDTTTDRRAPVQVQGLTGVAAIAAGGAHTVVLKQDGSVWAWGNNVYGQLGDGTITNERTTPTLVPGLTGVVGIAAGGAHTVALRQDGTVWAWGNNFAGQLGDGTIIDRSTPAPVPNFPGVAAIAAGGGHTVTLKQDGTVWAWGNNVYGQVGDGTITNERTTPGLVQGLTGVFAIAPGEAHTLALKLEGTVWSWGYNGYGQLADGTYSYHAGPVLAVNEPVDGVLDLIPEVPNNIPLDKVPPFFLATYKSGDLSALTLSSDVRGITPIGSFASATSVGPLAAGDYNVYIAASVPNSGSYVYYQLDSNNYWSVLTWPMADFLRGQALGTQDALIRVNILQNVDVRPYIGASIIVGYGTSPDEMLAAGRYRTIFTVSPPQ